MLFLDMATEFSPWRCEQQGYLRRMYLTTKSHGVTLQRGLIIIYFILRLYEEIQSNFHIALHPCSSTVPAAMKVNKQKSHIVQYFDLPLLSTYRPQISAKEQWWFTGVSLQSYFMHSEQFERFYARLKDTLKIQVYSKWLSRFNSLSYTIHLR